MRSRSLKNGEITPIARLAGLAAERVALRLRRLVETTGEAPLTKTIRITSAGIVLKDDAVLTWDEVVLESEPGQVALRDRKTKRVQARIPIGYRNLPAALLLISQLSGGRTTL